MKEPAFELEILALADALGGGPSHLEAAVDFDGPTWRAWYVRAEEHGLAPGLYRLLEAPRWSRLPAELRALCRARYLEQTARALGARRQWEELRDSLEGASIPVLPLKALAFSGTLYGDPGLRQFGDLDLLVPEELSHEAERCLHALGYRPQAAFTSREEAILHARLAHLCPVSRPGGLPVELHTHLLKGQGDDRTAVHESWEGARFHPAGFREMLPEHVVVYAACHYAGHLHLGGARLKWIVDLLRIARSENPPDWKQVREISERWQLTRVLAPVMNVLREHWQAPTGEWTGEVRPLDPRHLAGCPRHTASRIAPSALARVRQARELPGWGSRTRYFWHLAFPEAAHLRFRYSLPDDAPVAHLRLLHPLRQVKRWVRGWGSCREDSPFG